MKVFSEKEQREWNEIFSGSDACVTPILSASEAAVHPHNIGRSLFGEGGEVSAVPRLRTL